MRTKETEALRFSKATRFGVSVALISVLCISFTEVLKQVPVLRPHVVWGVGTILLAGCIALLLDLERYKRKSTPEEVLNFHRNPHFWGFQLVVTGVVVYFLCPPPIPIEVRAATRPEPVPEQVIEPVVFPELEVTAIVVNGKQSSARLNGTVIWLGESIQGAKLIEVSETNIVMELKGARKDFSPSLDKPRENSLTAKMKAPAHGKTPGIASAR